MKNFAPILASLILLPALFAAEPEVPPEDLPEVDFGARTWTNTDGREIVALLVEADNVQTKLELEDGKVVPVPLASLIQSDRDYVRDWILVRRWSWFFELLEVEYPSSFRTTPRPGGTRETIKPMMGKPDDILIHLKLKVTPPEGTPLAAFDPIGLVLKVTTPDGIVRASPKYAVPSTSKDNNKDGTANREILYQAPKGSKPAEINYKQSPPLKL